MRLGGRDDALRPFWLHQFAEYLLGLVLVAQGLQSPTPAVPALAGGLVLLNAALVGGYLDGQDRVAPAFARTARGVIDSHRL